MASNHFITHVASTLLRGGRLTKVAGKAASYAPSFANLIGGGLGQAVAGLADGAVSLVKDTASRLAASVSGAALAVALASAATIPLTATEAQAGSCFEALAGSGAWSCAGPATAADVTQLLTPPVGGAVSVVTFPGFGITTAAGDALTLTNLAGDTDITFVDAYASNITGLNNGISVLSNGTGIVSVSATGLVSGAILAGITAQNAFGTDLIINAATATGNTSGITTLSYGTGVLSITATGAATGTLGGGIFARNMAGTDLTINAATATGGSTGIGAGNYGMGALSITATGPVTGTTGDGINASNAAAGTDLTINAAAVTGGTNGIVARNNGTGALAVTATGPVTGTNTIGIRAYNSVLGTDLTIVAGAVSGGSSGIGARNIGAGALSITASGAVTGGTASGIYAENQVNGTNLTIDLAAVSGATTGVVARSYGSGALSITATGAVAGGTGSGIYANNLGSGTDLTIVAAAVSGNFDGIYAHSFGSGVLSISASGPVTGTTNEGIFAQNAAAGTSLTVTTGPGAVTGGNNGIYARNLGTAGLTISVSGNVTGNTVHGINAFNSANDVSASMLITQAAGTITTGALDGIFANNHGGSLTINAYGTSIGTAGNGIRALNFAGTTDLNINANVATGATNGIYARNFGIGALSVSTTGLITGTTNNGIDAVNSAAGTDLTIVAAAVSGNSIGIQASNLGTGALSVTATGSVSGTNNFGINAYNTAAGTNLTINAAAVSGGTIGINARHFGTGFISVSASGPVSGTVGDGIYAYGSAAGYEMFVYSAAVSGGNNGIFARSRGARSLTVTATGAVSGANGFGIYAQNDTGTYLIVNAASVTGATAGIRARNFGTGGLLVTATGAVTGATNEGIYALNAAAGVDLRVNAAAVSGNTSGIFARNNGAGNVLVSATGAVTGTNQNGIYALNAATGSNLFVTAAAVSGGTNGIFARNYGTAALVVSASGAVAGGSNDGIRAENRAGTNLSVTAATVTGGINGIGAFNSGSGALSVTATGTVTGASGDGIAATNSAAGTDLTINAAAVSGNANGISAGNSGTGAVVVNATGPVTGTLYAGISAVNLPTGTTMTITTGPGAVTGGNDGIDASNYGRGPLAITVAGAVTGTARNGIAARTDVAAAGNIGVSNITLNAGAIVTGGTNAIFNDAGASNVQVNAGAVVNGAIRLGLGSDNLTFLGADISAVTLFDGGDDILATDTFIDTLSLNTNGTVIGTNVINWEQINIGGTILVAGGSMTAGTTDITNGGILDAGNGLVLNSVLNVLAGGIFNGTGAGAGVYTINGNVTNAGLITSQDGSAGDIINIAGNYTGGGGAVNIDTVLAGSGSPTDALNITGSSAGATLLNVTNAGGAGALTGNGPTDGIRVINVGGVSAPTAFSLAGGTVAAGAFDYSLVQADGQNWYLQSALQVQIPGYSSVLSTLNEDIGTLWQRTGLGRDLFNRDGSASTTGSGFWVRTSYSGATANAQTIFAGNSLRTDLRFTHALTQLGYEQKLFNTNNGYLSGGLFGHYKSYNLRQKDAAGTLLSRANASGFGGGASLTWNAGQGFYGDLVSQFTVHRVDVNGNNNSKASFDALTYSASAEAGYRFDTPLGLRLVPQAQLTWRGANFDNFIDNRGVVVNWHEKKRLTGRIGLGLEGGNTVANGGSGLTGYAIADLLHTFGDAGSLTASGVNVASGLENTRVELRLGANFTGANTSITFFTEAGATRSLGSDDYRALKGVAGFKLKF